MQCRCKEQVNTPSIPSVPSKFSDNFKIKDDMLLLAFCCCPMSMLFAIIHALACVHELQPDSCRQHFLLFKSRRANVRGIAIVRIAEISNSKSANKRIYEQRKISLVKFQLFGKDRHASVGQNILADPIPLPFSLLIVFVLKNHTCSISSNI